MKFTSRAVRRPRYRLATAYGTYMGSGDARWERAASWRLPTSVLDAFDALPRRYTTRHPPLTTHIIIIIIASQVLRSC